MTGAPPVLSIGAVLGDSDAENMAWKRAVSALGKQVALGREEVSSPLNVNVVYHVDGRLKPNQFSGVRTGRFDAVQRHLIVQAAIPSGPAEDRRMTLVCLLSDAIDEAESFAAQKQIADGLCELRALVSSVR